MSTSRRVSIIGAGLAGLGAARALQDAGCRVIVWDKGRAPGGRVGTRHMSTHAAPLSFDQGAQNIKDSGTSLEQAVAQRPEIEVRFIDAPVCLHDRGQVFPGDEKSNRERKWSCREGMAQLPRVLAQGLDVRLQTVVAALRETEDMTEVLDADGQVLDVADAVIITAPAPQSAGLLEASSWLPSNASIANERISLLREVEYSRCLSVMLHFAASDENIPWYALLARDRSHPLLWLARENAKGFVPPQAGTALIAQLGHEASMARWEQDDASIATETCVWISEILGESFRVPLACKIKRWRYSQPRNTADFDLVNPMGARVLIAGDGVAKGRVPDAYESGIKAAKRVLES